jgi:hypothetical protein
MLNSPGGLPENVLWRPSRDANEFGDDVLRENKSA